MTLITDKAWIDKAKKRKAYRDHYRDKFFAEVGVQKGQVEQHVIGAPKKQRLIAVKLLNATRKGGLDPNHAKIVTAMAKTLASVGLGLGEQGKTAEIHDQLDKYSMTNLRKSWFYSPAFFD